MVGGDEILEEIAKYWEELARRGESTTFNSREDRATCRSVSASK